MEAVPVGYDWPSFELALQNVADANPFTSAITKDTAGLKVTLTVRTSAARTKTVFSGAALEGFTAVATSGFQAPSDNAKCRVGTVDQTDRRGIFRVDFPLALFDVAGALRYCIEVDGVTGLRKTAKEGQMNIVEGDANGNLQATVNALTTAGSTAVKLAIAQRLPGLAAAEDANATPRGIVANTGSTTSIVKVQSGLSGMGADQLKGKLISFGSDTARIGSHAGGDNPDLVLDASSGLGLLVTAPTSGTLGVVYG